RCAYRRRKKLTRKMISAAMAIHHSTCRANPAPNKARMTSRAIISSSISLGPPSSLTGDTSTPRGFVKHRPPAALITFAQHAPPDFALHLISRPPDFALHPISRPPDSSVDTSVTQTPPTPNHNRDGVTPWRSEPPRCHIVAVRPGAGAV